MAIPDNTLGAPTEGLGQNVTFAYNADDSSPQLQAGDPGRIRAGVIGGDPTGMGETRGRLNAPEPISPTLALLTQVGGTLVANSLKQKQTEAYVSGMQRAMQGEAVTDIANSQPWYAKLFGMTDVVEGARAYTGDTVAQTTASAMDDAMPELRKLSPADATKYYTDNVMAKMTGDPATDLAITQGITRALPGVMRRQAKEHYAYQQETATASESANYSAGAAALQKLGPSLANGYTTSPEFVTAQINTAKAQVPPLGRDEKNWQESKTASIVQSAEQGDFHMVNAMQMKIGTDPNVPGSGTSVYDSLTPEQRNKIDKAVSAGKLTARQRYLQDPTVNQAFADLDVRAKTIGHNNSGDTPQMLYDEAQAQNAQMTARTGNDAPLWTPNELIALKAGAGDKVYAARLEDWRREQTEGKTLNTAQAKADALAQKDTDAVKAFSTGNMGGLLMNPDYPKERAEYAITQAYRNMPPAVQTQTLANNGEFVVGPISKERENAVGSAVAGGTLDGPAQAAYQQWHDLYLQRPDAAAANYPKWGPKMEQYRHMTEDMGVAPENAFQDSFVTPKPSPHPNEKMLAATLNEITQKETGMFQTNMHPSSINYLVSRTADAAGYWTPYLGGDDKVGATRAYSVTKAKNDFEVIGKYAFGNSKGSDKVLPWLTSSMSQPGVPLATDTAHEVFTDGVQAFLEGARITNKDGTVTHAPGIMKGQDATNILFSQLPTAPGVEPVLAIHAYDKNGVSYSGTIPASYFPKYAQLLKDNKSNAAAKLQHDTSINPGKNPGSLFDQEEARAKLGH